MEIAIAAISIFSITGAVWLLNRIRILPFKVCPICAGVSGTWLWMLAGMFLGLLPTSNFLLPTSILMGGSVVGIAYQIEKRLPSGRSPLVWKILFIPSGFAAVYTLISSQWTPSMILIVFLGALSLIFIRPRKEHVPASKTVEELEEKMKNCC